MRGIKFTDSSKKKKTELITHWLKTRGGGGETACIIDIAAPNAESIEMVYMNKAQ